jgi:hypothetical protein
MSAENPTEGLNLFTDRWTVLLSIKSYVLSCTDSTITVYIKSQTLTQTGTGRGNKPYPEYPEKIKIEKKKKNTPNVNSLPRIQIIC